MATADLVFFSIKAGVRLYGAGRKAYVDSVRASAITLPLPKAPNGFTHNSAKAWFLADETGQQVRTDAGSPRLEWLLAQGELDAGQRDELRLLGATMWAEADPSTAPVFVSTLSGRELTGVLEVRQWAKSEDALPSPLQTIAGTLINIGVDYFAQTPGALSDRTPQGRALLAFLEAIDDTDFADAPLGDIAEDMLLAVLDTVGENPDLITGGGREKTLVTNITKTLTASAKTHLSDAPTTERWEASFWLNMVARSVLKGSSDTVLANPALFLGVRDGAEAAVVRDVGTVLSELVIGPEKLTFRPLLTRDGLDTIARAALASAAKNPEILKIGHQGLKNVLVALAEDLGGRDRLMTDDMLPELARLVLEKSADNMDLIWGADFQTAERHLLVTASRELLDALSTEAPDGAWSPTLTRDQLLGIAETVFDEVIDNPDWLLKKAGEANSHLRIAADAALAALRKHDGKKLSAEAGVSVVRASVKAVALQLPLLDRLPAGGADHGKVALTAVLDAVLDTVFGGDPAQQWRAARNSGIAAAIDIVLAELTRRGIDVEQEHIDAVRDVIGELVAGTVTLDQLPDRLRARFA